MTELLPALEVALLRVLDICALIHSVMQIRMHTEQGYVMYEILCVRFLGAAEQQWPDYLFIYFLKYVFRDLTLQLQPSLLFHIAACLHAYVRLE